MKNKKPKKPARPRSDWNGINPVTRIIPDKTKYNRKRKHKGEENATE